MREAGWNLLSSHRLSCSIEYRLSRNKRNDDTNHLETLVFWALFSNLALFSHLSAGHQHPLVFNGGESYGFNLGRPSFRLVTHWGARLTGPIIWLSPGMFGMKVAGSRGPMMRPQKNRLDHRWLTWRVTISHMISPIYSGFAIWSVVGILLDLFGKPFSYVFESCSTLVLPLSTNFLLPKHFLYNSFGSSWSQNPTRPPWRVATSHQAASICRCLTDWRCQLIFLGGDLHWLQKKRVFLFRNIFGIKIQKDSCWFMFKIQRFITALKRRFILGFLEAGWYSCTVSAHPLRAEGIHPTLKRWSVPRCVGYLILILSCDYIIPVPFAMWETLYEYLWGWCFPMLARQKYWSKTMVRRQGKQLYFKQFENIPFSFTCFFVCLNDFHHRWNA